MAGKVPGFRQVSAKEARELSKLPWVRDEAFSDPMTEARILPDGRVLLFSEGERGSLYPSRESWEKMCRDSEAAGRRTQELLAKGPTDFSLELLPPIEDFFRDVEAHAKSLGERLHVPDEALDRSLASLEVAYKAVLKLRKVKRMAPEIITPLTAYVGEVMRGICNGQWTRSPKTVRTMVQMYTPERVWWEWGDVPVRHTQNEPMIRAHDGGMFQPFAAVVLEIMEHGARGSLRSAVEVPLIPYLRAAPTVP